VRGTQRQVPGGGRAATHGSGGLPASSGSGDRSGGSTQRIRGKLFLKHSRLSRLETPNGVWRQLRLVDRHGRQPGDQIGRALEVEQGIGEGFQLLQLQGLDLGGGGGRKGAAAAVEETEGYGCLAFLAAFFAAGCEPVLCRPSVAQLFHGDASNHYDHPAREIGKPLHQHRQHNLVQIRAAGQDLLTARHQITCGPDPQVDQGIQLSPAAELL
jgi:hypothetical protein